jgi:GntR family transcriptional regulator, transcriptional repressor for pyruvate dehydrogenase complex
MSSRPSSAPMNDPADAIKPIGRPNLTREVVNAIARLIMQRVWRPGDSIPSEKELAARFGVGRSTIREAIQSLVTMGVVAIRPGEGSFIREPTSELLSDAFLWGLLLSPRNVGDFTEFRICVETTCAAAAARAHSAAITERLFELLQLMKADQNDDQRFKDHDYRFHVTIAEATGNPIFVKVVGTLQSTVRLWFPITSPLTGSVDDTHAEHRAIVDAIAGGYEKEARDRMRRHLLNAAERLTLLLSRSLSV